MDDITTSFPIVNNRYQILKTITSGGMSMIYVAQDLLLERKVALKILKKDLSEDYAFRNKFRSEARASANLNHINIITTYDFGFDGNRLFIVMELIDGGDLKKWITERDHIDIGASLKLLIQAAQGLSYAHNAKLVHCDVKPQNMLITREGIVKISDFGVARAMESISRDEKHDIVWGSPYYISPEQTRGEPPTPASDVYSLGVITYELLAGKLPFEADNPADLLVLHRNQKPIPPKDINSDIPDVLNHLILKSLAKDPADRFENAETFLLELQKIHPPYFSLSASEGSTAVNKSKNEKLTSHFNQNQNHYTKNNFLINWQTILLTLIALIAVGGLIPFWIYVFFSLYSFGS